MSKRGIWVGTSEDGTMKAVKSCGILIFKRNGLGDVQFLLLKHRNRYDLPKGHREQGETDMETACRELREETAITENDIDVIQEFVYEEVYYPKYSRFGGQTVQKTIVVFAAFIKPDVDVDIILTEHIGMEWLTWNPPHSIQKSVNGLLQAVEPYITL